MLDGTHYIECACNGPECTIRLIFDHELEEVFVDLHIHHSMKDRLKALVKNNYWEQSIMTRDEVVKLHDALGKFLDATSAG